MAHYIYGSYYNISKLDRESCGKKWSQREYVPTQTVFANKSQYKKQIHIKTKPEKITEPNNQHQKPKYQPSDNLRVFFFGCVYVCVCWWVEGGESPTPLQQRIQLAYPWALPTGQSLTRYIHHACTLTCHVTFDCHDQKVNPDDRKTCLKKWHSSQQTTI